MNVRPSLEEVRAIAETGSCKVLPVSCELLSDLCTPIQALKKLKNGKATQEDASLYGADLGECVSAVLNNNIRANMSWEELNGMAMPLFKEVHQRVFNAASQIQKAEDEKNNIHMNPIKLEDLVEKRDEILDPEFLVCTSRQTHNAIHYGNKNLLPSPVIQRSRNDTCPWRS